MEAALREMKRRQRFGLVFEEHIPETTALYGLPIQTGSLVQKRDDPQAGVLYRVMATTPEGQATIESSNGGEPEQVPAGDLLAVNGQTGAPQERLEMPIHDVLGLERRAFRRREHEPRVLVIGRPELLPLVGACGDL